MNKGILIYNALSIIVVILTIMFIPEATNPLGGASGAVLGVVVIFTFMNLTGQLDKDRKVKT